MGLQNEHFAFLNNNNDSCDKLKKHVDSAVNTGTISGNSDNHLEESIDLSPSSSKKDLNVLKYQYNILLKWK